MLKRIVFTLVVLFPFVSFSQTRALVSPNSRFFAIEEYNGKKTESGIKVFEYEYKIYHLQSRKFLHSFILQSTSDVKPDVVKFSTDGKTFCAKQLEVTSKINIMDGFEKEITKEHILKIWDVRSGKLIKESIGFGDIEPVFFNQSHYFLLITTDEMTSYDAHQGRKIMDYKFVRNTRLKEAYVSKDDKYIVVSNDRNQSMVWQVGVEKMRKRITGGSIKFSRNMKYITSYRTAGPNIFTYVYEVPSFRRVENMNAGKVLRDMAKAERNKMREENPDLRSVILPRYQLFPEKSNFGPNGKYIIAYALREFKEPEMTERKLVFIDPLKEKAVYEISETNDELSLLPYQWAGNNIFLVQTDSFNIDVLNLRAEQFVKSLDLNITYSEGEKALNPKKQLKYRIVSPNKRYVIMPVPGSDNDFYVKCTYLEEPKILVKSLNFIGFSPNSRHIFVKTDKGEIAVINTKDFEKASGKEIDYNRIKNMPDSLIESSLAIIQEFEPGAMDNEKEIKEDSDIPEDYELIRVGRTREINTVGTGDLISLYLKTIELYREKIGIQMHLLDRYGNLIKGAAAENYKTMWCNLIVESPDGSVKQIDDFEVIEHSEKDSMPTAIAIVMDHSGSMGNDRARLLQKGAREFIKNKRKEDAIAIVKYDHQVGVEAELSENKSELLKMLEMNGLGRFGGSTSLIDGINEGISLINNAHEYPRKAVIVLTDGNENSSYLTKNEIVVRAIRNNINVHVVGFGEFINQPYLVGIANHTEGSYFQMYDRNDFRWIFEDIYKRIKNYYTIRFNSTLEGEYKIIVELCPEKAEAEKLVTGFDYSPIDIDEVSLYFDAKDAFVKNTEEKDSTTVSDKKYKIEPIKNFDKIKLKNYEGDLLSLTQDSLSIDYADIEEEFQSIQFPDIKFRYNDVIIVKGTDEGLETVVEFLNQNPSVIIEIGGHTDDMGNSATNQDLSERRAINVKKRLLSLGAESTQIETVGYGDSQPIVPNNSEINRSINRRVEFKILSFE